MTIRTIACRSVIAAAALLAAAPPGTPASGWQSALDRLVDEKNLAESCAGVLKGVAVAHPMARVQGERLYARARADADGLIALLASGLAEARPPAESPELRRQLETVPRQRRALCGHVRASLRPPIDAGGAGALLERGSEAPGALLEASAELWQAYRRGDQARRRAIAAALEAGRWLPYARLPAPGTGSGSAQP